MSEFLDLEAARAAYTEVREDYKKLAYEVSDILGKKLKNEGLQVVSVTFRAKDADSFVDKIERKGYREPLVEMTDLAGVRVVCAYEGETKTVERTIAKIFVVRESVDKGKELGSDKMGYDGLSFVVSLGDRYSGGRYDNITNIKCEIQVRTILQDAWANISHQLVYKNEEEIPERLRRSLNNVASLLEIAQATFDDVKEKREKYKSEIEDKGKDRQVFLNQPLDFETVVAYARWKFPRLEASEKITQLLLRDIDLRDYPSLQQLDIVVDRAKGAVDAYQRENPDWFQTGTDYLTKSLGFVDEKFRRKHPFAQKTRDALDRFKALVSD